MFKFSCAPHVLVHWLVAPGVMAGLDLTAIDKILDLWKWSQHQEAAAKKKIEKYRTQVEGFCSRPEPRS